MDFYHLHDWAHLLIRWGHFLAGIMWIGTSLYFVWMDSSFSPLTPPKKGIEGELWMVHGGNFYHVEKRKFGPGEMPTNLHWFKWEATLTWITGFILLVWVYYLTNGAYLIDPRISNLGPGQASLLGLASVVISWLFYNFLYNQKFSSSPFLNVIILFYFSAVAYLLTHFLSGRGAFIHVGAIFGTMMVLNVWAHILPNQKSIIAASMAGQEPNYNLGLKAKKRSMHNSYMTLPTLFIMISNHFPLTYSHQHNWLILIMITAMGALIRHFMITLKKWPLILASFLLLTLMLTTRPAHSFLSTSDKKINFEEQIKPLIANRCLQCHSSHPSDPDFSEAPLGVIFEEASVLKSFSHKIYHRVVIQKDMPLQNKTQITEEERALLALWIKQGSPLEEDEEDHE